MTDLSSEFDVRGFTVVPELLPPSECDVAVQHLNDFSAYSAGSRNLLQASWCQDLANQLRSNSVLRRFLPDSAVVVQCTIFDKSSEKNWLVTLHQDLSIPVRSRVPDAGCTGWTEKEGSLFVQPPVPVLEKLVAVRLHLDFCGPDNGPLRVVPESHRLGRLSPEAANRIRERNGEIECLASKGGVVVMRPLLLHASSKARAPLARRVLHFLFGPVELPHGLLWQHAI